LPEYFFYRLENARFVVGQHNTANIHIIVIKEDAQAKRLFQTTRKRPTKNLFFAGKIALATLLFMLLTYR
jgi:hypothetical protein